MAHKSFHTKPCGFFFPQKKNNNSKTLPSRKKAKKKKKKKKKKKEKQIRSARKPFSTHMYGGRTEWNEVPESVYNRESYKGRYSRSL